MLLPTKSVPNDKSALPETPLYGPVNPLADSLGGSRKRPSYAKNLPGKTRTNAEKNAAGTAAAEFSEKRQQSDRRKRDVSVLLDTRVESRRKDTPLSINCRA
ncbi:MAG: hypothetical protein LBD67_02065 [Candidatus Accumulibacter sp.]|jgi:hypothetical protein|nr:hypothetical protein [Accumulibacter sp.]